MPDKPMSGARKLKIAVDALQEISDYIGTARRGLPKGYRLDGAMVVQIAKNPQTYVGIAVEALRKIKESP